MNPPLVFGTAYYPDHWPEADWARDLDRIAEAGLSVVRFGEFSWSWYEPEPGRFNFTAFDRFVDLVEQRDLKLCLCTPTATPPPWFDRLYPDGRLMDMHGRRCLSHRHFWSWNHAASRKRAEATITRLVRHYRGRSCLWGWQIDNEPNYAEEVPDDPQRWYDWNPAAVRDWVKWLRARYGDSLDRLNEAWFANFWSQRFGRWEELAIPRGRVNPHAWLDWLRWREANLAAHIRWQAGILRREAPDSLIGCNIPEAGLKISLVIGQDYWAQARAGLDWVGTDLYEATGRRERDLRMLAYRTDVMRSAAGSAEFLISELQAGPHERAWPNSFAGETWGPDYLRSSVETFAQRGAKQIWYFLWRPTPGGLEMGMNGLQNSDGSDSERTPVIRELKREAEQLVARRDRHRQRPVARVHYSRDSLRFRSFWWEQLPALEEALAGWHGLLEAMGYQVDFFSDEELPAVVAGTELVVLPVSILLSDEAVAALAKSPAQIVAGPHTGCCDERGHWRESRLPLALSTAWRVQAGPWTDVGALPKAAGLPAVRGWRQLSLQPGARRVGRLNNGAPLAVRSGAALFTAVDVGELWSSGTPAQRQALVRRLGLARVTGGR